MKAIIEFLTFFTFFYDFFGQVFIEFLFIRSNAFIVKFLRFHFPNLIESHRAMVVWVYVPPNLPPQTFFYVEEMIPVELMWN